MNLSFCSVQTPFHHPFKRLFFLAILLVCSGQAFAQEQDTILVGDLVTPDIFEGDLRQLPLVEPWQEGDSIRVLGQRDDSIDGPVTSILSLSPQERMEALFNRMEEVTPAGLYMVEEGDRPFFENLQPNQSTVPISSPVTLESFTGIPASGVLPPDVVGDVGPDHYIQMVNSSIAIYDKSGTLLAGPTQINFMWSGFGGDCESFNHGDPVVQYDHMADRWLVSQFAVPGGPGGLHECIAISQTPDPVSGGWFLYDFVTPAFPDYPRIGVWPDGYYMTTYEGTNLGLYAFDRNNMLAGAPANFIRFTTSSLSAISGRARTRILPSDLEGPELPPAGMPNIFARSVDGAAQGGGDDRIELYEFHADFDNPLSSSFTPLIDLPVDPYDVQMCGSAMPRDCIPQPGTSQGLDPLSNRLMQHLHYRNFGTHETMVVNQSVDVGSDIAGVRWYELRRDGGPWFVYQQGTISPDNTNRWMGSIDIDQDGNIAVGYTASSSSIFPSVRYSSRSAGDPLGSMSPEIELATGGGSQTHPSGRWGDYSSMNIDVEDECTFWFTSEIYNSTSSAGWRTTVNSFKFPSCGDVSPPVCTVDFINPGPPLNGQLSFLDNGSGLQTAEIIALENAEITINGVPTTTAGTVYNLGGTTSTVLATVDETMAGSQVVYARTNLTDLNTNAAACNLFAVNAGPDQTVGCNAVTSFTLINADTEAPVPGFNPIADGGFLNLDTLPPNLSIRANTCGSENIVLGAGEAEIPGFSYEWTDASSTVLATTAEATVSLPAGVHTLTLTVTDSNGETAMDDVVVTITDDVDTVDLDYLHLTPFRTEYFAPYSLFGDVAGDYTAGYFPLGERRLTATPTSMGTAGTPASILFDVIRADPSFSVTDFVLVDADTDADLFTINNGDVLDLAALPTNLNVRADVAGTVESVVLSLSPQSHSRTEEVAPYALFGDIAGDYFGGTFDTGEQYIKAVPYELTAASGAMGLPNRVKVTILNGGMTAPSEANGPETLDIAESSSVPTSYQLDGNYPNPFNPSTTIRYALPEVAHVRLTVYNVLGQEVQLLVDGMQSVGTHEIRFDAEGLPSGTYFYQLETPAGTFTNMMLFLK